MVAAFAHQYIGELDLDDAELDLDPRFDPRFDPRLDPRRGWARQVPQHPGVRRQGARPSGPAPRRLRLVAPLPADPSPPVRARRVAGPPAVRPPLARPAQVPAGRRRRSAAASIYWRRRLVALGLLAGCVLVGARGAEALDRAVFGAGGAPLHAETYKVRPGDTLWSIAEARMPSWDRRAAVDRLRDSVGRVDLQAGETIRIVSE